MKTRLFIALYLITGTLSAQPAIQWQKSLGGTYFDEAASIQQTSDGGYIVTGKAASTDGEVEGNHGGNDFWAIKLSALGSVQWKKTIGGSNNDWPYATHQTIDGGYILSGFTESNNGNVSGNHGDKDAWVVKLNPLGELQWQKCYGGTLWEEVRSIKQTSDDGYVFAGIAESNDGDVSGIHGDLDCWVIKLDNLGNLEWQKTLGGTSEDIANDIKQTSDGGFIVAGSTRSNDGDVVGNHGSDDYWIVKLTASGEIEWQKALGGNSSDIAEEIWPTNDGGYIVTGYASTNNSGDITGHHGGFLDAWIVKLNSYGNLIWQKPFGGSGRDWGRSIQELTNGNVIIGGTSESNDGDVTNNHGYKDAWVAKIDTIGEIIWQKSLGGTLDETCHSIQQTMDGGYVFAGYAWSNDGDVSGVQGYNDFWIVKLHPESTNATQAQALEIYPNPTTQSITIQIPEPETTLSVSITDLLGRELSKQSIPNGGTIKLEGLADGLYWVTATTDSGRVFLGRVLKLE